MTQGFIHACHEAINFSRAANKEIALLSISLLILTSNWILLEAGETAYARVLIQLDYLMV